ncbi:GvpL/GvpF family gas vesicle protein [Streptomyces pactum]|uniref:GvpL/GvpF family gas vesicle protein n=1 Tax=Streptomyces pactum TaxID=68249 RepID=A0ABS0NSX7_9ACTN|nr:GvpL/GvpF family gas vesicle protein [Streptomyces pactum]MBH5338134.1 GvpL/GvpF family gas vesicle protein [Streptomyces pactum]
MPLYVYAITRASHPLRLDGLTGVGEGQAPLRAVRGDALCAVVSDSPEGLTVGRRDLQAHHDVQQRLWEDGTVLPLSFGFVAADEEAVHAVLRDRGEQFTRALEELTGRVEFNVKAVQDEGALLREVLDRSPEARRLNEATRDGGGAYEDRLALGQLVAQQVQAGQEAVAGEVLSALRPLALGERLAPPSQQYAVNASFLVDVERVEEFTGAGRALDERFGDAVEVRLRGPLPPYSFI